MIKNYTVIIYLENNQLTEFEKDKNTKMLEINTIKEHLPINDINKDYGELKSNIQEQKINPLSSLTPYNYQKTDKVQILDKSTESSATTTSSMVIINYNCLYLTLFNHFIRLYNKNNNKLVFLSLYLSIL